MPALALNTGSAIGARGGKLYQAALYPLPPWEPENGFTVDPALLFALMRIESRFEPEARSGKGATGLMQILPSTAQMISDASPDHPDATDDRLLEPEHNLSLGQEYVKHLSEQPEIQRDLLKLIASYNWGPGNLSRWA